MKKLIIIGNGFDLAHGLKTNYNAFIEDLINKCFEDKSVYEDIIEFSPPDITSFDILLEYVKKFSKQVVEYGMVVKNSLKFKNKFIGSLISSMVEYKWCDVEYKYFEQLRTCYDKSYFDLKKIEKLNCDFDIVKKYLIAYLINEEKKAKAINSYEHFFRLFASSEDSLILNFNYTRTIENLYENVRKCPFGRKCQIVHIHGELENEENPIIFGYAANREEQKELLFHNENECLRNIKKYWYKITNNERILKDFLQPNMVNAQNNEKIIVFILGHSCGLSDKLILNGIFNNEIISSIQTFYHETSKNYFDVQVNIDRIMDNDNEVKYNNLIVNYPSSLRMPQWNDNKTQINDFIEYIAHK